MSNAKEHLGPFLVVGDTHDGPRSLSAIRSLRLMGELNNRAQLIAENGKVYRLYELLPEFAVVVNYRILFIQWTAWFLFIAAGIAAAIGAYMLNWLLRSDNYGQLGNDPILVLGFAMAAACMAQLLWLVLRMEKHNERQIELLERLVDRDRDVP